MTNTHRTETTRQRNARLRKDILDANAAHTAAVMAEAAIRLAYENQPNAEAAAKFIEEHGDDWNAAHDKVTATDADIRYAESAWRRKDIDPNTLALIDQNID